MTKEEIIDGLKFTVEMFLLDPSTGKTLTEPRNDMDKRTEKTKRRKMTIQEAIKKNPFDSNKGDKSAYCRYLRYNVEGWYNLDSKEVLKRWQSEVKENE